MAPKGFSALLFASALARAHSSGSRLSAGCLSSKVGSTEELGRLENVTVDDYISVKRQFYFLKPGGVAADSAQPAALLLSFHGQTGDAQGQVDNHCFGPLGSEHGFMSVYPQGMDDGNQGTGWNVGTGGDDSTCRAKGADADTVDCYESCSVQTKCGKCNWSTCFDDVLFVKSVLAKVTSQFCVDLNRIYVHGESNGAMFTHYLVQEMPDTFAAAVPWFGLPLLGYATGARGQMLRTPDLFRQTAMLQLHARSDTTIPMTGGEQENGWIYEPLSTIQSNWAALHGCDEMDQRMVAPWHGGDKDVICYEHANCLSGKRVGKCIYDGVHGDYPQGNVGDDITVWFMTQFSRATSAIFSEYSVQI